MSQVSGKELQKILVEEIAKFIDENRKLLIKRAERRLKGLRKDEAKLP